MSAGASLTPTINAALNAASACCLLAGYWCVRTKRLAAHRACMLAACGCSIVFLISYVAYHARVGTTHFTGVGWVRGLYFAILGSHTLLAIVIVPLVARTVYLALASRIETHRRLARVTFPLWLYVSVTGVIVYWMLYQLKSSA